MERDNQPAEVDVLVSIVTWNSQEDIVGCLDALRDSLDPSLTAKILVHDNASGDDTVALIRKHHPEVDVHAGTANEGFGAHRHNLERGPRARAIAIVNPDSFVERGSWPALLDFMDDHQPCVVGAKLFRADGSFNPHAFHLRGFPSFTEWLLGRSVLSSTIAGLAHFLPDAWSTRIHSARHEIDPDLHDQTIPVERVTGCFFVLSGDVWRDHGLFDPAIFLYAEDIEFFMRISEHGVRFYYVPVLDVTHLGGRSSRKRARVNIQHNLSYSYIYRKHFGAAYAWGMHVVLALDAAIRLVFLRVGLGRRLLHKYDTLEGARQNLAYYALRILHPFARVTPADREPGDAPLESS